MLTRAACKLDYKTLLWEPLGQNLGDWLTVSLRRGSRAPCSRGRSFVKTPIIAHQAPARAFSNNRLARMYISSLVRVNIPSARAISGSVNIAGLTLPA